MTVHEYEFRRPGRCSEGCGGCCVEVAVNVPGVVALRDSKTGVTTEYDHREWSDFIAAVKGGEFDV